MKMPRKFINERDPSNDAVCGRVIAMLPNTGRALLCASPVQLIVYDDVVIQRCQVGHLGDVIQVLPEEAVR